MASMDKEVVDYIDNNIKNKIQEALLEHTQILMEHQERFFQRFEQETKVKTEGTTAKKTDLKMTQLVQVAVKQKLELLARSSNPNLKTKIQIQNLILNDY